MKLPNLTLLTLLVLCLNYGCSNKNDYKDSNSQGILRIFIEHNYDVPTINSLKRTKAPSASDMTLDILKGSTVVARYSPIGSSGKVLTLDQGTYTLNAYSEIFTTPKFDNPVYGTSKNITITAGRETSETLTCYQTNAGVKITYGDNFKAQHTTYSTSASHEQGLLDFVGADASRTGYFSEGALILTTTADGKTFTNEITLKPKHLYSINIDQEAPNVSGSLNLKLTIVVDVISEDININLPPSGNQGGNEGETHEIYYENVGNNDVGTQTDISAFSEWLNTTVIYGGSLARIRSNDGSDYAGASGGNYVYFSTVGSNFTISNISTTGYKSLKLTFGSASGGTYDMSNMIVTAYNGNIAYPLTYTRSDKNTWEKAVIESGIPETASMKLVFTTENTGGYKIDDIKITGVK